MSTGVVEYWCAEQIGSDGHRTGFWGKIRVDVPDGEIAGAPIFFHGKSADRPDLIRAGTLVSYSTVTDPVRGGVRAVRVRVLGQLIDKDIAAAAVETGV